MQHNTTLLTQFCQCCRVKAKVIVAMTSTYCIRYPAIVQCNMRNETKTVFHLNDFIELVNSNKMASIHLSAVYVHCCYNLAKNRQVD